LPDTQGDAGRQRLGIRQLGAIKPAQSLTEPNAPNAPLAKESASMDFGREDRAPERPPDQAIWKSVKGAGSPMPATQLASPDGN
jgi:hypothetical protein